jgi:enterochelin esterase-like enzyme
VSFALSDPDGDLRRVVLVQELRRPRRGPAFRRVDAGWRLDFPRLGVDRMEYRIELTRADGTADLVCDLANPRRAPGPFGERSVVHFPGYREPSWVGRALDGEVVEHDLAIPRLGARMTCLLWAPAGTPQGGVLPLLVAHDGPEYARYSGLLGLLEDAVASGRLPPLRAALLPSVNRDEDYSASSHYAAALADEILLALRAVAPAPAGRNGCAGLGASLGALSLLHAHRAHPDAFGALFLQSGSFFRRSTDPQESRFSRFDRVDRWVARFLRARRPARPIPVGLTCGRAEENLLNNLTVRDALDAQGYEVCWKTGRDAHNWVAWRNLLDPGLVDLLGRVWR